MGATAEVRLPTNPNCIVFAAEAPDALNGRSWSELLRIPAAALRRFTRDSGLPAAAYLAWRVANDRRNQRHHQVTMLFVFDGPASAEHIAILEQAAAASAVFWTQGSIERIPANAVPVLMVIDDRLHQLWTSVEGRMVLRTLRMSARGVVIRDLEASEVDGAVLDPDAVQALALPPEYEKVDLELERMRLVFSRHFAQSIVDADGVIRPDEVQFMEHVFPDELMRRMGVAGKAERLEWFEEALRRLPIMLGHHDKLALIGLFFSACYSDGSLDAREMRVLREAGEALGLTRQQVVKYLQRFW